MIFRDGEPGILAWLEGRERASLQQDVFQNFYLTMIPA